MESTPITINPLYVSDARYARSKDHVQQLAADAMGEADLDAVPLLPAGMRTGRKANLGGDAGGYRTRSAQPYVVMMGATRPLQAAGHPCHTLTLDGLYLPAALSEPFPVPCLQEQERPSMRAGLQGDLGGVLRSTDHSSPCRMVSATHSTTPHAACTCRMPGSGPSHPPPLH
jgi:hypothetical protein